MCFSLPASKAHGFNWLPMELHCEPIDMGSLCLLPCSSLSVVASVKDYGCFLLGYSKHWQHLLQILGTEPDLPLAQCPHWGRVQGWCWEVSSGPGPRKVFELGGLGKLQEFSVAWRTPQCCWNFLEAQKQSCSHLGCGLPTGFSFSTFLDQKGCDLLQRSTSIHRLL